MTDQNTQIDRAIASIKHKKFGARILCTNLFFEGSEVVYFTGFGPTQEVKAFAQLLSKESELTITTESGNVIERKYNARALNQIWISKGPEGHSLLFSLPKHTDLIFAPSEAELRQIFYRCLEQQEFVVKDWFPQLFAELPQLSPLVGTMHGCWTMCDVEKRIKEGVRSGEFQIPTPKAHLTIEKDDSRKEEGKDAA